LKVIYDAKYPVPPSEVCAAGGQDIDKILGAGASTLENFIVKRKLMGPVGFASRIQWHVVLL
jgi:DNA polymerase alpha subunit A